MIRRITLAEARKRAIATLEKIEADRRISAGLEAATWRCCDYPEHDALEGEREALRVKLRQAEAENEVLRGKIDNIALRLNKQK